MSSKLSMAVGVALVALMITPATTASAADDDRLRAAFVLNLAKYVAWPDSVFADGDAPLVIGVIEDAGFRARLAESFAGKQVGTRGVEVRDVVDVADARNCHLVYGGREARTTARSLALELRGAPVLSVAEYDRFAHVGGTVAFEIRQGKISFEISRSSADRGGLKVSSKLLRLATAVR